jgi:hypothetical protein
MSVLAFTYARTVENICDGGADVHVRWSVPVANPACGSKAYEKHFVRSLNGLITNLRKTTRYQLSANASSLTTIYREARIGDSSEEFVGKFGLG